jgi:hypothetical protein
MSSEERLQHMRRGSSGARTLDPMTSCYTTLESVCLRWQDNSALPGLVWPGLVSVQLE